MMTCPGKVKPLQSNVAFSCLQRSGNKYNNNYSFNLPSVIAPILQALEQYLDLEQHFPVQIHNKTIIFVSLRNVLKSS